MNGGTGQRGRIDAAVMADVGRDVDDYMRRPCHRAPADGLTPIQRIRTSTRTKVLAAAEWEAMDARGNLPADWPERRAQIEARFA